jgi:RHS repeat-associated protein
MTGFTTTGSAIGFTGHVNDPDTDLVYMQQRYYDPIAGRFLSVDPVVTDANSGGGFNRYNYANNSPYKYVDPDGRAAALAVPIIGGVLIIGGYKYATDPQARAVIKRILRAVANGGTDEKSTPVVGHGGTTTGQRPSKTPNEGEPGSTYINPGSGQEREYGEDGKPVRDTDYDHDHGQGVPHIHDWGRDANGKPVRGPGRPVPPKSPEQPKPEDPPKPPEPPKQQMTSI